METGAYMRPWLSAFVRGAGTLYSVAPMALLVWVPSALWLPSRHERPRQAGDNGPEIDLLGTYAVPKWYG